MSRQKYFRDFGGKEKRQVFPLNLQKMSRLKV
jgi:hypothetical protein